MRINRRAAMLSGLIMLVSIGVLVFLLWLANTLGVETFRFLGISLVVVVLWAGLYIALADGGIE